MKNAWVEIEVRRGFRFETARMYLKDVENFLEHNNVRLEFVQIIYSYGE